MQFTGRLMDNPNIEQFLKIGTLHFAKYLSHKFLRGPYLAEALKKINVEFDKLESKKNEKTTSNK